MLASEHTQARERKIYRHTMIPIAVGLVFLTVLIPLLHQQEEEWPSILRGVATDDKLQRVVKWIQKDRHRKVWSQIFDNLTRSSQVPVR